MGILDKLGLRKRKIQEVKEKGVGTEAKPANVVVHAAPKTDTGRAYQILLRPILSEKGTHLAGGGKYVFAVNRQSNKSEIKKSIEKVYGVNVEAVKIINLRGKHRRYGRTRGVTAARKKAIVTVRAGEKIPGIIEAVG